MKQHLRLCLDAPLMSFGGDMIDAYGVVRDWPARSMITGLLANALGYDRTDSTLLNRLQQRLVMGSVRAQEGFRKRDFQTAKLEKNHKGWTTHGKTEGRAGGAETYNSRHIRYRDVDADAVVWVVLRLEPTTEHPTLDDLKNALQYPERPLFLGRKPFLPSEPLFQGIIEAPTVYEALSKIIPNPAQQYRAQWPVGEGSEPYAREEHLTDERNWLTGVHAGLRRVMVGNINPQNEVSV